MAKLDNFKIGIEITTTKSVRQLRNLHEILGNLSRRLKITADRVNALSGALNILSEKLPTLITRMDLLGDKININFKEATEGVRAFNRSLEKSAVLQDKVSHSSRGGHFARHVTRELASETGMPVRLGIGAVGAYAGGAAGMAAAAAGYLGYKSFESFGRVSQTIARMNMSGFGKNVGTQAFAAAQAHPMAGISYQAYLSAYNDAMSVLKGLNPQKTAGVLAPTIAKMSFANRLLFAREGRQFTNEDQLSLLKASEIRAHSSDPNKIKLALNKMEQAYIVEQGTLPAHQLRDFARRYAAYMPYLTQKGLLELLPTMQAMGGSQLGSGLRVLQSRVLRGQAMRTGKRAEMFMASMGLLLPDGSGRLIGASLLQQNPNAWIMQDIIPKLKAHGYKTPAQINQALSRMFAGVIPAMITQIYENRYKALRTVAQAKGTPTISGAYQVGLKTPFGESAKLSAAWERFTVALGKLSNPGIIRGLNALTKFLNFLTTVISHIKAPDHSVLEKYHKQFMKRAFGVVGTHQLASIGGISLNTNPFTGNSWTHTVSHGVTPHAAQPQVIHNHIHIDGKHVASQVTKHIVNAANRPQPQANSTLGHQVYQPVGNNLAMSAFTGGVL